MPKGPDKHSRRSMRRENRADAGQKNGAFKSVEQSTRKGRRAAKRSAAVRSIKGAIHEPGAKIAVPIPGKASPATHTAGGGLRYH